MCGANPHLGNKSWPQAIVKNTKKGALNPILVFFRVLYFCGAQVFLECKFCSHYSEKIADKLFDYIKITTEFSVVLDL